MNKAMFCDGSGGLSIGYNPLSCQCNQVRIFCIRSMKRYGDIGIGDFIGLHSDLLHTRFINQKGLH